VFARWARGQGEAQPETDVETGMTAGPSAMPAQEPGDGAEAAVPAAKGTVLEGEDPLQRWETEMDDRERGRLDALAAKLGRARRTIAEGRAMPAPPQVPPEALAALTAEGWRQVGEAAQVPGEALGPLLEMLEEGTTISAVATRFDVKKWTARTWLENLRGKRAAYVVGERAAARWMLGPPPGEGDAQ
jgi:hypothetical protein